MLQNHLELYLDAIILKSLLKEQFSIWNIIQILNIKRLKRKATDYSLNVISLNPSKWLIVFDFLVIKIFFISTSLQEIVIDDRRKCVILQHLLLPINMTVNEDTKRIDMTKQGHLDSWLTSIKSFQK